MTAIHDTGFGAEQSRLVTWHDPMHDAGHSRRRCPASSFWRAVVGGQLPPPPIAELMRMHAVEAEDGRVTFTCTPDASMYNPLGIVHGGAMCTLLDTATGCALHTTLPAGRQLHQR